jgi:predicted ATPase
MLRFRWTPITLAMRRFILTGTPGAGKTALLRQLELDGFGVVEAAATDVIALWQARGIMEAWRQPGFLEEIVELQRQRQIRSSRLPDAVQFHDRSAVCTAALAEYLGLAIPDALAGELKRANEESIFEKPVFFIRNLGVITHTDARRITWDEALRFEGIHEDWYSRLGFELIPVEAGTIEERAAAIKGAVERFAG